MLAESGGYLGCCPDIVLGPKGSVIQPFSGYRGNAAIIVNWGHPCPHRPWRRACTINDHGFMYADLASIVCVHGYAWDRYNILHDIVVFRSSVAVRISVRIVYTSESTVTTHAVDHTLHENAIGIVR